MKRYTREQIEEAVANTKSALSAARYLGCYYPTFKRYAEMYGLFSTNQGGKGIPDESKSAKTADEAFQKDGSVTKSVLVSFLKQEREWKCECCGLTEWQGKPLSLEVHHINGDRYDNRRENLQILCPNCHSVTDNWKGRNSQKTHKRREFVTDEELLEAIRLEPTIAKALARVGLSEGPNRYRVRKLLADEYLKEQGKNTKA